MQQWMQQWVQRWVQRWVQQRMLYELQHALRLLIVSTAVLPSGRSRRKTKIVKAACALFAVLQIGLSVSHANAVTLELKSGSTIKGDLISWNGEQALIKAEFGEIKLSKAQLSTQALSELALSSGDASALKAKIRELQSMVDSLRRDNTALREQLAGASARPVAAPASPSAPAGTMGFAAPTAGAADSGGYWISSTGKRHNANCRYYQTSKGRPGSPGEGVGCKICGG